MKVYRISKCAYINDLSGTGALFFPGRWHNRGTRVLYTAESAALAMLESVAHITSVISLNLCLICLQLPEAPVKVITPESLPENRAANPAPDILKAFGEILVKENKYIALKVPSVILPEESNYILNVSHPAYAKIKVVYSRSINIDDRLLQFKK